MESRSVAKTIKEITRKHLTDNNGLLLGESISAVGWVNNTVPNVSGIVELPMTDVAGAGIAVGVSLVGRRPIFVIRFQDFLILNGSPLIFYAAKIKELHGNSAPVFVRAIASDGLGPVHSGVLHSVFMHFPGFRVCSPMTPKEYEAVWDDFMKHDAPFICSEHRTSYQNTAELPDKIYDKADITLYAVSVCRFEAARAAAKLLEEGIKCNLINLLWLKPFVLEQRMLQPLNQTKRGLVVDPCHEISGAARSIAYDLSQATGHCVKALGIMDKTKCLCEPLQNKSPDASKIASVVKQILDT